MFSGVIANFQSSRRDGGAEMAGIDDDDIRPCAGDEDVMRGEEDMVADAESK
jgi:hypothetical protein